MESGLRQYQAIWLKLKTDREVSVTAPRPLHARILKAVKKEKNMDLGFKLSIEPRRALLQHSRKASILTFYLTISLCEEDF